MSFLRSWIFRLESEGILREQSVPLPAYNKYMGAVDLTDLFLKPYGFDRKSKRCWLRPLIQCRNFAINTIPLFYTNIIVDNLRLS